MVLTGWTKLPLSAPVVERKAAPDLFEKREIASDSIALVRNSSETFVPEPAWFDKIRRVDPRIAIGVIVAIFACAYVFLVKALRKGPGGGGMTNT